MDLPHDSNGLIRRTRALDLGFTDEDIADLLADETLLRVVRGVYVAADLAPLRTRTADLYRLRCLAIATGPTRCGVLSHQSAAAVLGLELLEPDRTRVHLTTGLGQGGMTSPKRHTHCTPLDDTAVQRDGVLLTNVVRTAVDVAVGGTFAQALTVFDSALRIGTPRDELATVLTHRRRRGIARARVALAMADGRAANPGESWSRAQMIEAGLPLPVLQRRVLLDDDLGEAFPDFSWDDVLAGEFDGEAKYHDYLREGETEADVVLKEKNRENGLRDLGFDVVRWDWPDLRADRMIPRVTRRMYRCGLLR
ncbi:hypothetical protein MUG78_11400 [Gordonia alkaliphila]|uniref:Transcriptional regulator, AbiEi antitoxin, Type IV TA system n=1 Tax=Gordonia alkaliphila TaxID=1053547 RepID=A0ABP8Z775_9ACTN|nr:hypothetical protein [Gordonia alkaliphila]MCK0440043.1 hypothetical protein [Gordonia alkaliphila]